MYIEIHNDLVLLMVKSKQSHKLKCLPDNDNELFLEDDVIKNGCPWCQTPMEKRFNIADPYIAKQIKPPMKTDSVWYYCSKCSKFLTRID